jgi:hypothetical protein
VTSPIMFSKKRVVGCCAPLLVLGVAVTGSSRQTRDGRSVRIPLPAQWVPFSADSRRRGGGEYSHGKFYRARDGSTAVVIDSADGPIITIHNRTSRRRYSRLPGLGWIEQEIPEASLAPPKLELALGGPSVQKLDMTIAGGDVYEMAGGSRHTRFAVALNGMVVYLADAQGVVQEFTNIVLGERPQLVCFCPSLGPQS